MSDERYKRLWTIENREGFWRYPAEVVWEAESAAEILNHAAQRGFVVRGPYVLEESAE